MNKPCGCYSPPPTVEQAIETHKLRRRLKVCYACPHNVRVDSHQWCKRRGTPVEADHPAFSDMCLVGRSKLEEKRRIDLLTCDPRQSCDRWNEG